jgi:hypothetical protein
MKQWIIKTILGEIILCGTPLTLTFICLCLVVIRSDCDLKQNKTKQKQDFPGHQVLGFSPGMKYVNSVTSWLGCFDMFSFKTYQYFCLVGWFWVVLGFELRA